MDWLEILKQATIIFGVGIALHGINAWKREHVGKRKIELAEETLALFYEAVDVIKYMRHPMSFPHETEQVQRANGESDEHFHARKNASVVFYRYNKHQELFNKIHASRYRFMARIGKEEAEPFDQLHKIVNEINGSARALARLWPREHFRTEEQYQKHRAHLDKHEAVFWEGLEEEDPINPRLDQLIERIESVCMPVIKGKNS